MNKVRNHSGTFPRSKPELSGALGSLLAASLVVAVQAQRGLLDGVALLPVRAQDVTTVLKKMRIVLGAYNDQ